MTHVHVEVVRNTKTVAEKINNINMKECIQKLKWIHFFCNRKRFSIPFFYEIRPFRLKTYTSDSNRSIINIRMEEK